jgi:hypothetical protein
MGLGGELFALFPAALSSASDSSLENNGGHGNELVCPNL